MPRKKKTNPSVTPSINPTPEIKEPTPEEVAGLGIRDVERQISNKPIVVGNEGGRKMMAFKNVIEKDTIPQPYLNQAEVEKLGIRGWWPHRGEHTTIIKGRRFKLTKEIFQDLKDRGLVLAVGVGDAPKWRNK